MHASRIASKALNRTLIANARLALPEGIRPGSLLVEDGQVAALLPPDTAPQADAHRIEARGNLIAPGLIDIHVHGGGGYSLMTDDPDEVRGYARWVVRHGVTSFLVSTSGRDHAQIVHRLRGLAPTIGREPGCARVLGFHLEGPYVNPVRKGAFDARWLRPPSTDEYRELFDASGGAIKMMTLAPELDGADDLIRTVVASGATAAMGHTDATYEQARHAIDLGVTHVTHCFNAMRPFNHRDPGVLGAVLSSDEVSAELIGDGAHVHYAAAGVLLRAKGAPYVVLVTDAMPLAGTPDGEASWEGVPIRVDGGKAVRVADGTIIGGVMMLEQMVRNAVTELGLKQEEALALAARNPARAIHAEAGELSVGHPADFVLLDHDLNLRETWIAGECIFAATE